MRRSAGPSDNTYGRTGVMCPTVLSTVHHFNHHVLIVTTFDDIYQHGTNTQVKFNCANRIKIKYRRNQFKPRRAERCRAHHKSMHSASECDYHTRFNCSPCLWFSQRFWKLKRRNEPIVMTANIAVKPTRINTSQPMKDRSMLYAVFKYCATLCRSPL